jgi:hypothetical protein
MKMLRFAFIILAGLASGYYLSQSALAWLGGIAFAIFLLSGILAWLNDQLAPGRHGLEKVFVVFWHFTLFYFSALLMNIVAPTIDDPTALLEVKKKIFGWLLRK